MQDDPLILTAAFDPRSRVYFQRLRDLHFPAPLNIVPAHLTLFHHLPGGHLDTIAAHLAVVCAEQATMPYRSDALRFLGRGVAFDIAASALVSLRERLALRWRPWLTRQDSQTIRPHVTIQNKVAAAEARALFEDLSQTFEPVSGTLVGLDLWYYRNGPWAPVRSFSFDGAPALS